MLYNKAMVLSIVYRSHTPEVASSIACIDINIAIKGELSFRVQYLHARENLSQRIKILKNLLSLYCFIS